jgi:hypothetical protein
VQERLKELLVGVDINGFSAMSQFWGQVVFGEINWWEKLEEGRFIFASTRWFEVV